ncbi:hypothetical protein ACLBR5_27780 [Escherichia coli]
MSLVWGQTCVIHSGEGFAANVPGNRGRADHQTPAVRSLHAPGGGRYNSGVSFSASVHYVSVE